MKRIGMIKKTGLVMSLSLASSIAMAANYDLSGSGFYDEPRGPNGDTYVYQKELLTEVYDGMFSDTFTFTAPEGDIWDFSASAFSGYGIEFDKLMFLGHSGITEYYEEGGYASASIGGFRIMPGSYTMSLSGMATGLFAEYEIEIALNQVSPVPEPSSIALMLGGLGLVGFMAARRRQQA